MFEHEVDEHTSLARVELRDAPALFALVDRSRVYLRRWLPWVDATKSVEDVEAFLRRSLEQHAKDDGFQCCIRHDGELAGVIGFHRVDWTHRTTEIGYWIAQGHQGRGIVTECCRALVDFAFLEYDLNRVEIRVAVDNEKSRGIPERLGFTNEGSMRQFEWVNDRFLDGVLYAVLRREWLSAKTPS